MKGLVFERNLARFAAVTGGVGRSGGSGRGASIGPLRLTDVEPPELPGPGWRRVRPLLAGICGSDLSTLDGRSSRYFEDVVSFPFVPGHEVVGTLDDTGARVVIEPVLGCVARGIVPLCPACAEGRTGGCERVAFGHLAPGLQIGFCTDTGGGWSAGGLVAHEAQLHAVPDELSDDDAVMVEPTACAVHAALAARAVDSTTVAVLGAGTLGLCTVAALAHLVRPGTLLVGAKHAHQRRLARRARRRRGPRARPGGAGRASQLPLARGVGHPHRRRGCRHRLRRQRRVDLGRPWPWCGPGAGWCSWGCRGR